MGSGEDQQSKLYLLPPPALVEPVRFSLPRPCASAIPLLAIHPSEMYTQLRKGRWMSMAVEASHVSLAGRVER